MKKSILILTAAALLLASCSSGGGIPAESTAVTEATETQGPALTLDGDTYVISEDKYLEGVQEIYKNPDKYIGKRIQVEGVYVAELYVDEMYFQVYRNIIAVENHEDEDGHNHSHNSEAYTIGFRFEYEGNKPNNNSFVRVAGVVEEYESGGEKLLLIRADTLENCENVGKTYLYY